MSLQWKWGEERFSPGGGGYLENEEKRESKGIISLLPILVQGPPKEIRSSPHFEQNCIVNDRVPLNVAIQKYAKLYILCNLFSFQRAKSTLAGHT